MNYVIVSAINLIFQFFTIIILIDVIASWIVVANVRLPDALFRILAVVHNIAGVVLNPIRRFIPSMGGFDLSPIIALIVIQLLQSLLVRALRGY
jgi:YggT family protein